MKISIKKTSQIASITQIASNSYTSKTTSITTDAKFTFLAFLGGIVVLVVLSLKNWMLSLGVGL